MKNTTDDLLVALAQLQKQYPHWRFGQLIANAAAWAGQEKPGNVWDVSDKDLLQAVTAHLKQLAPQAQRPPKRRSA